MDAEAELALHLAAVGAPAPVRQHPFSAALGRQHRFDFCWPAKMLAVEVDGAVHRIKARFKGDIERHNIAQLLGWTVLRFSPADVAAGRAVLAIEAALAGDRQAALAAVQGIAKRSQKETS